jgi:DNA-binding NtrC family response regulator
MSGALGHMSTADTGTPRQPGCVLVLEDDIEWRRVLVELMETEGFKVSICDSYALLCEAVRVLPGCIVLADFWGTSHVQLSPGERDQIRDLGIRAPTILLTGRGWADTVSPDELNVVAISSKPPALDELVAHVARCLKLVRPPE